MTMISHTYLLISLLLNVDITSAFQFVAVGDWGDDGAFGQEKQRQVAGAIDAFCATNECNFILSTGDNFYPQGVLSLDDPKWEDSWRSVYDLPNIAAKQWLISIGNHDHDSATFPDTREQIQVDYFYQRDSRWYFPSLWYSLHFDASDHHVYLVVFDSQSLRLDKNNPATQLAWIEQALASANPEDWIILMDHHPPYSMGNHGPYDTTIMNQIQPLAVKYGVHVFLSGHEHNLEHISNSTAADVDYVISGGGGRGLYAPNPVNEQVLNSMGLRVDYFGFTYGFVTLDFSTTSMIVQYFDEIGNSLHTFSRSKASRKK